MQDKGRRWQHLMDFVSFLTKTKTKFTQKISVQVINARKEPFKLLENCNDFAVLIPENKLTFWLCASHLGSHLGQLGPLAPRAK